MSRDVKECLFRHDSAFSASTINTCSQFTAIESHHSLSLLQKHDLIRDDSRTILRCDFPFILPVKRSCSWCILVQDLPLLAAPCRWDHHLCTDLKQEGEVMENAVGRTVRRTRSYKHVMYPIAYILVWTVRYIHSPWRSAGRFWLI